MKHELEMCCGTTCDKNANAEYVAWMEREVRALRDEVKRLREAEVDAYNKGFHAGYNFND